MDTLTHIALGACVGEAMLGKKLGKKAMLIGAFANSIPDLDFVSSFWLDVDDSLLAHRGFTHSFLFGIIISIFLAMLFQKWFKAKEYNLSFKTWVLFLSVEVFLHLFIDAFNAYGVGWFEPFSHYRVSFNAIFVADPFYSIWLGIALVILLILKKENGKRLFWAEFGLGISTLYFMYCIVNKIKTDTDIRTMLKEQHIGYNKYFTTPTPLNNWLWCVTAGTDSGFYIGYYSVFDRQKKIDLNFFAKNDSLLNKVRGFEDVQHLLRFSKGFYTIEKWNDTLVFNDLRFEQITGWYDPHAKFVFHYFLQRPHSNQLVVQRGRFANWNLESFNSMVRRIKGN
ncbi:MAG: metal-dependent hydrolase [Bacteroidota bacterium]